MTDRSAPNLCEWCCHPATPGGFAPLVAVHGWPDTVGTIYLHPRCYLPAREALATEGEQRG